MRKRGKCYRALRCKTHLRHLVAQATAGYDARPGVCLCALSTLSTLKEGWVPAAVEAINGLIIGGINQSLGEKHVVKCTAPFFQVLCA